MGLTHKELAFLRLFMEERARLETGPAHRALEKVGIDFTDAASMFFLAGETVEPEGELILPWTGLGEFAGRLSELRLKSKT
jgi:hypothetical protein